jgi:hypothetical protein
LIEHNVSATLISDAISLIDELFSVSGDYLIWRAETPVGVPRLWDIALSTAEDKTVEGRFGWSELCVEIARRSAWLGPPDAHELRECLADSLEVVGKTWRWRAPRVADESARLQMQLQI